ncbi:MAG: hypothetical protein A2Y07_08785 [Planctomycetes bacterium GWF2_50_10]|nr:MAG: hypothetical protein A2Y07_08785 [Planctomycetes bacterium GWF2_50_10]
MAIKYTLCKSPLAGSENRWSASIHTAGSAGLDDVVDRIVAQGTTVRRADVLAVLENTLTAVDSMLLDGMRVQLGGIVDLFPRIKGTFDGPTDAYDPTRHKLDIAAMAGRRLRSSFQTSAAASKRAAVTLSPSLAAFSQTPAPQQSGIVIPGSIAVINGFRLKFDSAKADEGIFFCPLDGSDPIKASSIQKNTPKELIFLVPALATGKDYHLEIRARIRGGSQLRTGRLDATLTLIMDY